MTRHIRNQVSLDGYLSALLETTKKTFFSKKELKPKFSSYKLFSIYDEHYIDNNGKKTCRYDSYNLKGKHKIKFTFVKTSYPNEQCIILSLLNTKCRIYNEELGEYHIPKSRFPTLDIFEKSFGKEVILDIDLQEGEIGICNGAIKEIGKKE